MKYFLFLLSLLFISCAQPKQETVNIVYNIQSIRLDDDSEYHILAISNSGSVKELHDLRNNFYELSLSYTNIKIPILICKYELHNGNLYIRQYDGYPKVILPFGYKIETFDD